MSVNEEWSAERVAAEIRRARDEREEEDTARRARGQDPEQVAAYHADQLRTTEQFRSRVGVAGIAFGVVMAGTYLLFGRNLEGTSARIYAFALMVLLAIYLGWMTWHLARSMVASVRGYRAVKANTYVSLAERTEDMADKDRGERPA